MKLLYCEDCGDIVCPNREASKPRPCRCGRHQVWWRDPQRGELSVYDKERHFVLDEYDNEIVTVYWEPSCYVLGLHNSWLQFPRSTMSAGDYQGIIDSTPDSYLFKKLGTVAIRIRPGHSSDTKYDSLPGGG